MSKNFSYLLVFGIIVGILLLLVIEDSPKQTAPTLAKSATASPQEQPKKKKEKKEVTINFIEGKNKKEETSKKQQTKAQEANNVAQTVQEPQESTSNKTYELVNASTTVGSYYVNVVSDNPIPRRNPAAFPQIPATIIGTVDNKPFSLTVPSDLGVEDFKIRIKNEDTGIVHTIALEKEHTKPGSSTVLNVDTNNLENIELRTNNGGGLPPPPPLPPIN